MKYWPKTKGASFGLWLTLVVLVSLVVLLCIPVHAQICEKGEYPGTEDCAAHNIVLVAFWQIIKATNDFGIAISALATVAVAGFTWTLWRATNAQGDLTRESIRLARDEFNASHRPKLVVREVQADWVREQTTITFVIINEGDSEAHNIECEFEMRERMGPFDAGRHPITFDKVRLPTSLAPGRSQLCHGRCGVNMTELAIGNSSVTLANPIAMSVYFRGTATYTGATNIARRSAYYRPFDFSIVGFRASDDPEREYPG